MERIIRSPLFAIGAPLTICGFGIGLNYLLRQGTFGCIAVGLLAAGLAFILIGWLRSRA